MLIKGHYIYFHIVRSVVVTTILYLAKNLEHNKIQNFKQKNRITGLTKKNRL